MRRFRVAERSMTPALEPGDEVVATDSRRPEIGDIVVFEHPTRDGFWMIKRVAEPPGAIDPDTAWVLSDNLALTRADSRRLGPIAAKSLLPVVDRLEADLFAEACDLLASEDENLSAALRRHGPPSFWRRPPGFPTLALLILEQQVSLESGAAVYRRLTEIAGEVSPQSIIELGPGSIKDAGVTRQKAVYLTSLAESVVTGRTDLVAIGRMGPREARDALTEIHGIGPWTADAYLLSALGHIDVLPVGDRALQVGVGELLGMSRPPSSEELETLAEPWRPVRAAAARIVWHSYLSSRGRGEPGDALLHARLSDMRRVERA